MSIISRIIIASVILKSDKKKRLIELNHLFIEIISDNNIDKIN